MTHATPTTPIPPILPIIPTTPITPKNSCQHINEITDLCSSCGNCLFACPVYNAELEEPLSPRGRVNLIKYLLDGRLKASSASKKMISQCALCGSCENICTNGVKFTEMMIDYRNKASQGSRIPFFKKIILYFYQSLLFKKFAWVVDLFAATPLRRKLTIPRRRKASISLKKLCSAAPQQEEYDILFFPGCVTTHFYPAIIEKSVALLREHGFSVVIPEGYVCCGFPYLSQGWQDKFVSLRQTNIALFSHFKFKYLVVPCGTGAMAFQKYYEWGPNQTKPFEIFELTQFFYTHMNDAHIKENFVEHSGEKVTWHDPCHNVKSLGLGAAPRHFLKQLGEQFVDDKSALCCGFAGIFSVGFPATSKKILHKKVAKLTELGAHTVVTACPGCYMHLRENLDNKEVKFFTDMF